MALMIGRHVNRIDRKGRISVPKPFRDAMAGQMSEFAGVYAYPLFKEPAIEVCSEAFMQRLSDSIDDLAMFSEDHDDLRAILIENAHPLPFDPEGRVVLPQDLIRHAELVDEALFVGRGKSFQIWSPTHHDRRRREALDRVRARGATLKLKPQGSGERA
jgi:MraZ protein